MFDNEFMDGLFDTIQGAFPEYQPGEAALHRAKAYYTAYFLQSGCMEEHIKKGLDRYILAGGDQKIPTASAIIGKARDIAEEEETARLLECIDETPTPTPERKRDEDLLHQMRIVMPMIRKMKYDPARFFSSAALVLYFLEGE